MGSSKKGIDMSKPIKPSTAKTNMGYRKTTTVRVNNEIGSTNPANCTDSNADTKTTTRTENLIHLRWMAFSLFFFGRRMVLSNPSMVVPMGQIHPQKKRPRTMENRSNTNAGIILMINERIARDEESPSKGSILRKKSTGILEVKG